MKKSVLLIMMLGQIFLAHAQTKGDAKLYGFKEPVVSGVNPTIIDSEGKTSEGDTRPRMNYFIYLQAATRVYPTEIWIDGKFFGANYETIQSPVERQEFRPPGEGKTVLVPATDEKLLQLSPYILDNYKASEKGAGLAKTNELVVVYKKAGKLYYTVAEKMKELTPVALQ